MASAAAFKLDDDSAYQLWRARKLSGYPSRIEDLQVEFDDPNRLSRSELTRSHEILSRTNMLLYSTKGQAADRNTVREIGAQFGLMRLDDNLCAGEDSITALTVADERRQGEYIPYTNQRLNWHTDGYYNRLDRQVRGFILHCADPAATGGGSALMDPEIAYLQLRDKNPEFIRVLSASDVMAIPANVQNGVTLRPEQTGPVFSIDAAGHLHMRYSARTRNVIWKDDSLTQRAVACLLDLFEESSPFIFRHRLDRGEGILSNNALHCRTAFEDGDNGDRRLLYRARYFDRVADPRNS